MYIINLAGKQNSWVREDTKLRLLVSENSIKGGKLP